MGTQLVACCPVLSLRKCCQEGHVHDQCHRIRQFEFPKSHEEGGFPKDAVRKIFYLRIEELYKKWNGRPAANWALVRSQLVMDDRMQACILKYERD